MKYAYLIKKRLKTERIYVHKGKSRTRHFLDSRGVPTQGKLKNSKHTQEKKLIDMKNLLDAKEEIKL